MWTPFASISGLVSQIEPFLRYLEPRYKSYVRKIFDRA